MRKAVRGACKFSLLASATYVAAFCSLSQAAAQTNDSASPPQANDGAPPPRADTSGAGDVGLQDIIVTARKRAERAQDTPISLTVLSGEALTNRSVTQFTELQRQTPALHMTQSSISGSAVDISMRGQALIGIRLNIDPAVGVYVDGVYYPRTPGLSAAAVADIDRVEVLAGPQGTLYGKNTTGGALVIYTKAPTTERFEGNVSALYGSYGERNVTAVINAPVTSNLAVRLVGNISGRDGYGRNLILNRATGRFDTYYFRGAALYKPLDNLSITLRGDFVRTKMFRESSKGLLELDPLTPGVGLGGPRATVETALEINGLNLAAFQALPLATQTTLLQQADAKLRTFSGGDPDDSNQESPGYEDVKVWGYSATVDYAFSDQFSLKSITAYRAFDRHSTIDQDGTPYGIIETTFSHARDHQFSEEFQLAGSFFGNRLKSLVGLFYSNESGFEDINSTSLIVQAGANPTSFQNADVGNSSLGIFTQNTLNVTDKLSLTAGIRYTKDKRNLTAFTHNSTICTALGVTLASIGGAANCVRPMGVDFSRISYTAGLEYRPVRDIMLYAKTSRGYRAGGLQENAGGNTVAIANTANTPFKPETVDDIEVGIKSEFLDRRVRVNLALYHSKVKDAQRSIGLLVPGTTTVANSYQNAASVKIDGIEFDLAARPVPGLELGVNGAYTNARFGSYITPTGQDFTNIDVLMTPKWQYGLSAAYTADIGFGQWRNAVDYSWTGRQLTGEPAAYSPSHGILNARTSIAFKEHGLQLAFFVKNITDKRYLVYPQDVRSSLGFIWSGPYNPPRTFGGEVKVAF